MTVPDPATTYLNIAGERLVAIPEHPFYTRERGWVPAGLLKVGERVRKATGGWGTVRAVRSAWDAGVRYNLTVDGAHTYAVGDGDWVAHNSNCFPEDPLEFLPDVPPTPIAAGYRWRPNEVTEIEYHGPNVHVSEPGKDGHYHVKTRRYFPSTGKTKPARIVNPNRPGSTDFFPGDPYP